MHSVGEHVNALKEKGGDVEVIYVMYSDFSSPLAASWV